MEKHGKPESGMQELDHITRRFKRVMLLINSLIVLMVIWILWRALSKNVSEGVEMAQALAMTTALVLLAIVHGFSLRKTRVQDVERIRFLAMHDGLTKVYNLRYLNQSIDREIKRSNRFGHPFAMLYIDLDRFKQINDAHGHRAGDKVLVEVATLLGNTCRVTDMVGRMENVVGRIGGDEFLVLMPETDAATAQGLARRFIERLHDLRVDLEDGREAYDIGASIGVVAYPEDGEERSVLVEKADAAMYTAKRAGGNCYCDSDGDVTHPPERPSE